ncbi:hypothetical protein M1771_05790 [Spiroplasma citri]|uniref:Transmembrane protein n=1 Tax=Spiroplasma citri TaxID=2133 RepID=A0AAX3SWU5_SPICI|nr:hypothetical protein [Spiroplasma citri]WFG95616.1 hypothetical protein M0C40_05830 [Spiroplasma citri]WFG99503.1 hypothetical protein M1771_05790 [Spiroplasma citri]
MLNNLSKKMKFIWLGLLSGVLSIFLILGIGLTVPGMGLESLKFINSLKTQIQRAFPHGKFVINGKIKIYETLANTVLKSSYEADILSALNFYEKPEENEAIKQKYLQFAATWFYNRWGATIAKRENIDLYDIGLDLIEFDKSVATKFHSYGYVHTGMEWMFRSGGINQMFSSGLKEHALIQQTINNQEDYNQMIDSVGPDINGLVVNKSIGTYLVNNKVWFLNMQLKNLSYGMTAMAGESIFVNPDLTLQDIIAPITVDDLYHPNFVSALNTTRAGTVFILMWPFLLISIGPLIIIIIRKKN